jgi:L-alanine-DL-glutamate epimerase-like enolase superfamily enzyme
MKITAIRLYPVWVGIRNQLLVKVETDAGLFGWGESGLSGRERAVVGAIEHYREFLIGRDPFHIGAIWQEMYRSQYFEGEAIPLRGSYFGNAADEEGMVLHSYFAQAGLIWCETVGLSANSVRVKKQWSIN